MTEKKPLSQMTPKEREAAFDQWRVQRKKPPEDPVLWLFTDAARQIFLKWFREDRWNQESILGLDGEEEEEFNQDPQEWLRSQTDEVLLERMDQDPDFLAQEMHQIAYDNGWTDASDFLKEVLDKVPPEHREGIKSFIYQHSEHSH